MHPSSQRWSIAALALAALAGWQSAAATAAAAADGAAGAAAMPNPFYAYCVGIGTDKQSATLKAQLELAPMLADLGYAGMAHVGLDGAMEMLEALEKHDQKLVAVYTELTVNPGDRGYDPRLKRAHPQAQRAWHPRVAGGQ